MEENQRMEKNLFKLSCKELKKIARQSNINPNFKKADLIKALLNVSIPVSSEDIIDVKEIMKTESRMTRSRASIMPLASESVAKTDLLETLQISNLSEENAAINEVKLKTQRSRKLKEKEIAIDGNLSDVFKVVSSIPNAKKNKSAKAKPLTEITNKTETERNEISKKEEKTEVVKQVKSKKSRNSKQLVGENSIEKTTHSSSNNLSADVINEPEPQISINNSQQSKITKENNQKNTDIVKKEDSGKKKMRQGKRKKPSEEEPNPHLLEDDNENKETTCKKDMEKNRDKADDQSSSKRSKRNVMKDETTSNTLKNNNNESNADNVDSVSCKEKDSEPKMQSKRKARTVASKSCYQMKSKKDLSDLDLFGEDCSGLCDSKLSVSNSDATFSGKRTNSNKSETDVIDSPIDDPCLDKSKLNIDSSMNITKTISPVPINSDLSSESNMPVPALVRGSTFILDDSDNNRRSSSGKRVSVKMPPRNNTFTLDKQDEKPKRTSTKRSSLRFIPDPELQKISSPLQVSSQTAKSIGKRILSASKKENSPKSSTKFKPGSGYVQKFGVIKKAPNFKNIHQKLFGNMESVSDNHQRKLERAKAFLQSPVPRCAVQTLTPKNLIGKETKSLKQTSSPLLTQTKTPKARTPVFKFSKTTTPGSTQKPAVTTATKSSISKPVVNRFGFKTRVGKEEANTIAGKKLPPVNVEKKKEQDRKFLQGVRTNKRFMLQMQMRQNQQ